MKRTIFLTVGFVLLSGVLTAQGPGKRGDALKELMVEKLKSSQNLLEGLALSDFDNITRNADNLIHLSNMAEWKVISTPQFEVQSNEFRRAAESIIQKSREKNIDGVTLAYFELTMSCVHCHKYVRDVRSAAMPGSFPRIESVKLEDTEF